MHNGIPLKSVDIRKNYETKYPGLNDDNQFGGTVRLLLNVPFVSEIDAGQYICVAENEHGKTSQSIKLSVKSKGNPAMVITDAPGSVVTISESDNLKFVIIPCVAVGQPKPKMSWDVLGRHKAIRSNHYPVAKGLKVKRPTVNDSEVYVCTGENKYGRDTIGIKLVVLPNVASLKTNVTSITVDAGERVAIECKSEKKNLEKRKNGSKNRSKKSVTTPVLTWSRGISKLDSSSNSIRYNKFGDVATLVIPNARFSDSGEYVCRDSAVEIVKLGESNHDRQIESGGGQIVTVTVNSEAPVVRLLGPSKRLEETGDTAVITCLIEKGEPIPQISWNFNGELIEFNERVRPFTHDLQHNLKLVGVDKSFQGKYSCKAENELGERDEKSVEFLVQDKPVISINDNNEKLSEKSLGTGNSSLYELNDEINLDCIIGSGDFPMLVQWKNKLEVLIEHRFLDASANVLRLSMGKVTEEHSGLYHCIAENEVGVMTKAMTVNVVGLPPDVKISRKILDVIEGERLIVECEVSSFSETDVEWVMTSMIHRKNETDSAEIDNKKLPENAVQNKNSLFFRSAEKNTHDGDYLCEASNEHGSTAELVTINVVKKPETPKILASSRNIKENQVIVEPGESLKLTCIFEAIDDLQVTWSDSFGKILTENKFLSIQEAKIDEHYTCDVWNKAGRAKSTVKMMVLAKPVVHLSPKKVVLEEGDYAKFVCDVKHASEFELDWFVGMDSDSLLKLPSDRNDSSVSLMGVSRGSLRNEVVIRKASVGKTVKIIVCEARNLVGIERKTSEIDVLEKLQLKVIKNSGELQRGITPFTMEGTGLINLTCIINIEQEKLGIFGWYRNGRLIDYALSQNLVVENPTDEDGGEYTCVAARTVLPNQIKTAKTNVQIIKRPPVEILGLKDRAVEVKNDRTDADVVHVQMDSGETLNMLCKVNSNSDAVITWNRQFIEFQNQDKIQVSEFVNGFPWRNLSISELTPEDSGRYECLATNVKINHTDSDGVEQVRVYTLKKVVYLKVKKWVPHFIQTDRSVSYISMNLDTNAWSDRFSLAMGFRPDPLATAFLRVNILEKKLKTHMFSFFDDFFPVCAMSVQCHAHFSTRCTELSENTGQIPGADGVLLFASGMGNMLSDFIWLGIHRGHLEFRYDLGSGSTRMISKIRIMRGKWNFVRVMRQGKYAMMVVNEREKISGESPGDRNSLDLSGDLYIGGFGDVEEGGAGFHGCIKDFILNRRMVDFPNPYTAGMNGEGQIDVGAYNGTSSYSSEWSKSKSVNVGSCTSFRVKNKKRREARGRD